MGGEECEVWVYVVANWGFKFEMIALETLVEFLAAKRVGYISPRAGGRIYASVHAHRTFYPTTLCLHPRASKKTQKFPVNK